MTHLNRGGYDDGYEAVPCLWGTEPGSLVQMVLSMPEFGWTRRVLDIGCGEGKNAAAFARSGCQVDAVDCSPAAIANGKRTFTDAPIKWLCEDARTFPCEANSYDIVVGYGVFHCLSNNIEVDQLVDRLRQTTRRGGLNIVCTFNDRSHDLSAHPGFAPLLLPHQWYVDRYLGWELLHSSDADLIETHPHNLIRHHHSLTRIIARRP